MIKYRVTFNSGNGTNYYESTDLNEVKGVRDATSGGGQITAIERTYFITNDPQMRTFEDADSAEPVLQSLQSDTFQLDNYEQLLDPQPTDLN
jgi:hypothetical protein